MVILDKVAERVAQAERIDCYSVGAASTFIAHELHTALFRLGLRSNTFFDMHQQLMSASTLGAKGGVRHFPCGAHAHTLEAARYAREHGATVVDPLTRHAVGRGRRPGAGGLGPQDPLRRVGTETQLAHLVVIEILMVRLAQKLGPVAVHGLQGFKQLLQQHGLDSDAYIDVVERPADRAAGIAGRRATRTTPRQR